MTKIRLFSDLHLEFRDGLFDHIYTPHPDDKETILLLAGDIGVGMMAKSFVIEMCNHFHSVLMILGNHEVYYNDLDVVRTDWANWDAGPSPSNFHFLDNGWRIIDGVRFLGGTMWTDFNDGDFLTMNAASAGMNDYRHICNRQIKITPAVILQEHENFIKFLIEKFDEPFDGKTVVMTHHSPGNALRRLGGSRGLLDYCYFANLEQLVGYHDKANIWVHGHLHESQDYVINNTRVIANPYGYWGYSTNPTFDSNILIEV